MEGGGDCWMKGELILSFRPACWFIGEIGIIDKLNIFGWRGASAKKLLHRPLNIKTFLRKQSFYWCCHRKFIFMSFLWVFCRCLDFFLTFLSTDQITWKNKHSFHQCIFPHLRATGKIPSSVIYPFSE